MLLILVFIGLFGLGILISAIAEKMSYSSVQEKFEFFGGLLIIINLFILIIVIGFGVIFRLPPVITQEEIEFEETYKTLTISLNSDKNNLTILVDKVADYNSKVKQYYVGAYDPWLSWFYPRFEKEPEYINLEDYLGN
jgi:hypothetical protein